MTSAPQTTTRTQIFEQMDRHARQLIAQHLADAADLRAQAETASPERAEKLRRKAKGHQSAATRITKAKGWS